GGRKSQRRVVRVTERPDHDREPARNGTGGRFNGLQRLTSPGAVPQAERAGRGRRRTGDRLTGDDEPLELERAAGDAAGVSPEPHRPAQRLGRPDRDQLPVVEHDPWTLIRPVPNEHRPRPEPQGTRGTERNTDPGADRRPYTSLAER